MANKFIQTLDVIDRVSRMTDTVLLYYSGGGKDSIALLDLVAPHFKKVVCVYEYIVKGLGHIQPYLDWVTTRYKNTELLEVEHPTRLLALKEGFFCDPHPDIKVPSNGDLEKQVREMTGIKYAFSGMKGQDGFMKRMRLKMFAKDYWITDKGMVYPLAIWKNTEVLRYISQRNLIKPFTYGKRTEKQVSQGFLMEINSMLFLIENYPKDYEMVLKEFPYAEKLMYDFVNS